MLRPVAQPGAGVAEMDWVQPKGSRSSRSGREEGERPRPAPYMVSVSWGRGAGTTDPTWRGRAGPRGVLRRSVKNTCRHLGPMAPGHI